MSYHVHYTLFLPFWGAFEIMKTPPGTYRIWRGWSQRQALPVRQVAVQDLPLAMGWDEAFAGFVVRGLVPEVGVVEVGVVTSALHEFVVTAFFGDASTVEHDDAVGVLDG